MDEGPAISAAQLKAFLHEKVDGIAERIVSAVNAAAPGRLIADSEEPVRQAMAELTRAAYEAALQQKVNAAEAAFPPPHESGSEKRLRNKGRQARQVLTINGRVKLVRRWWHSAHDGRVAPSDQFIDPQLASVSPGVREMACRLNLDVTSFDITAANLLRTALIKMTGEHLRQLVVSERRRVLAAQQANSIPTAFQAREGGLREPSLSMLSFGT